MRMYFLLTAADYIIIIIIDYSNIFYPRHLRGEEREEVEGNGNLRENRGVYIVSLLCFVCSLPVLCLVLVCLLFSVFCSLLSVNQPSSSVI